MERAIERGQLDTAAELSDIVANREVTHTHTHAHTHTHTHTHTPYLHPLPPSLRLSLYSLHHVLPLPLTAKSTLPN